MIGAESGMKVEELDTLRKIVVHIAHWRGVRCMAEWATSVGC